MGDPDHRVAMHRLVQERKKAGLPQWAGTVRLRDIWRNKEMTFEERRDAIVRRIRASRWFKKYDEFDELPAFVEELSDVDTQEWFDYVWSQITLCADYDRIWLELL